MYTTGYFQVRYCVSAITDDRCEHCYVEIMPNDKTNHKQNTRTTAAFRI